jgi:REP-associated tyrosine transposase
MSRKYKFHNPSSAYFVSFATVNWVDVFTRETYFKVLANSISYCREYKGMELFAFRFMPSHVHLLFRSDRDDPSGLLRDFKGYTSKKMLETIINHSQESRKEWMLEIFEKAGKKNSNITKYQFWQQHNKPIELWSTPVIKQKLEYVHNNPVQAGFVTNPWDWKYSSSRNYAELDSAMEIDHIGFLG